MLATLRWIIDNVKQDLVRQDLSYRATRCFVVVALLMFFVSVLLCCSSPTLVLLVFILINCVQLLLFRNASDTVDGARQDLVRQDDTSLI